MFEKKRWSAAWKLVGASASEALLAQLIARYSEPGRYYHTLQHFGECFATLDSARHLADTRANDNEEKSAQWAERALIAAGASGVLAERVSYFVLATSTIRQSSSQGRDIICGSPPRGFCTNRVIATASINVQSRDG